MSTSNNLKSVLSKLFDGFQIHSTMEASLPLVDFDPVLKPQEMETLANGLNSAIPWEDVTAIVGLAERSSGPLVHLLAHRRRLPYSLVNWYPEGSEGDIRVGPAVSFTGEKGNTFLNGLVGEVRSSSAKPDCIVFVDDCLRNGTNARKVVNACQAAGVKVKACAFVANIVGAAGATILTTLGTKVVTLCDVDATDPKNKTKLVNVFGEPDLPNIDQVKAMTPDQMRPRFKNVLNAFIDKKIYYAKGSSYPYCSFPLTDFMPMPHPDLIEDMAICMVWLGDFSKIDLLVSEADRGGGPLVVAVGRITGLSYTLANWTPPADKNKGVKAGAQVGYSGTGSLYLNGIPKGARCAVVDDMLSSGGTAEGLFRAIETAGGVVSEAHFASEKVNTGGRIRLGKNWPKLPMYSLCYFLAHGPKTLAYPPGPMANETPIQKFSEAAQDNLLRLQKEEEAKKAAAKKTQVASPPNKKSIMSPFLWSHL